MVRRAAGKVCAVDIGMTGIIMIQFIRHTRVQNEIDVLDYTKSVVLAMCTSIDVAA
jgi:hypothetical protein